LRFVCTVAHVHGRQRIARATHCAATQSVAPDFTPQDFRAALDDYASRERRFGLTGEQIKPPARAAATLT
jgi:hypothetical protein